MEKVTYTFRIFNSHGERIGLDDYQPFYFVSAAMKNAERYIGERCGLGFRGTSLVVRVMVYVQDVYGGLAPVGVVRVGQDGIESYVYEDMREVPARSRAS